MRDLPQALLDVARYDTTAKAAVEAIRHGADPVETLAAAVAILAEWKRAWSPEAMRAMMLRPPAPLHICCVGKHGEALGSAAASSSSSSSVASEVPAPLTREQALMRCARAGERAVRPRGELPIPLDDAMPDVIQAFRRAVENILNGYDFTQPWSGGGTRTQFVMAVLAEARRLVASGECPALANEPALRGGA